MKTKEEIFKKEMVTKSDLCILLNIGNIKADGIFDCVKKQIEEEGKIVIPGRIPLKRLCRAVGISSPKEQIFRDRNNSN